MKILFIINFIAFLLLFMFIVISFIKSRKNKYSKKIIDSFFIMGIPYLILCFLFFLWYFDFFKYSEVDFLLIYSMVIAFQTVILFKVDYFISENKIILYFLFSYFLSLLALIHSYTYFLNFFLIVSFLLTLIISMNLTFKCINFKKSGIFLIIYAIASLIFQLLILFLNLDPILFSLGSCLIFLIFLILFLKDIQRNPVLDNKVPDPKKKSYAFIFFRSFIFVVVIANFIFMGTVGIHELGHFTLSKIYSCENSKIVYEGGSPYTEALCKSSLTQKILLFGGFLPFLIALFLFIFGGSLMKYISLLITGFNLAILYEDFVGLGLSDNLIIFFVFIGIILIITGIMMLAKSSTEENSSII